MSNLFYIGIGGTGARVAEALVHLCAAGHGPSDLFLFLVDPDEGNGNLSRTKTLIAKYQDVRRRITDRAPGVDLFRTNIVTPDPLVWTIFSDQNMALSRYVGLSNMKLTDPALAQLAEVLFSHEELNTALNEGFRGHPSIGAVVMARPDETRDPWKTFYDQIANLTRPGDAKVFLVGSIFGGTGAAGVPTFASEKLIKHHKTASIEEGKLSKVHLGGCLVLPYFTFSLDVPEAERARMHVTPSDFPLATRAALQYYALRKLNFDDVYLIGDSLQDGRVGDFAPGAARQENSPHYIEMAGALAALDFFAHSEPGMRPSANYFTAARSGEDITWAGLPVSRNASNIKQEQDRLRYSIVTATLFFYSLCTYGREALVNSDISRQYWYKENFRLRVKGNDEESVRYDPRGSTQKDIVDRIAAYGELFLQWMGQIHEHPQVKLLDIRKVLDAELKPLTRAQAPRGIGSLIGGREATFDAFIQDLDSVGELRGNLAAATAADKYVSLYGLASSLYARTRLDVQAPEGN
jgi:hypothetical protein